MDKAVFMNVVERRCCLLNIRHKLFRVRKAPAAIFLAKEVMDSFGCILHYQVWSSILDLTEVIDWQDIGMLQVSNALCLVKKAVLPFFVELLGAQHFECQDTAKWRRFAHFVNMAIGTCAYKSDYFIDADARSFNQKVTSFTGFSIRGIFMPPTRSRIQTTSQYSTLPLHVFRSMISAFHYISTL